MTSILIKDTTREERIRIVHQALWGACGIDCEFCSGCDNRGGGRIEAGKKLRRPGADEGVIMLIAPDIENSTIEERRAFIKARYPCIADCDMCGLCKVFRGKNAEQAYDDYITGKRSFVEVSADFKRT